MAKKASYEEKYAEMFDSPFGVDEYDNGKKRFGRGPAYVIVGTVAGICKVLYRYEVKNRESLLDGWFASIRRMRPAARIRVRLRSVLPATARWRASSAPALSAPSP